MGNIMYFVKTIMKDGYKMNHCFCDFLSAIKLCEQINIKKAKSIILSQKVYNGHEWNKYYESEDVDMLDLLIDKEEKI